MHSLQELSSNANCSLRNILSRVYFHINFFLNIFFNVIMREVPLILKALFAFKNAFLIYFSDS
jgi:hypothetical protein